MDKRKKAAMRRAARARRPSGDSRMRRQRPEAGSWWTLLEKELKKPWARIAGISVTVVGTLVTLVTMSTGPCTAERERRELIHELRRYEETYYDSLIKRYPLGYVIWMRDHHAHVSPPSVKGLNNYRVDWPSGGPVTFDASTVTFQLPRIVLTNEDNVLEGQRVTIPRRKGERYPFMVFPDSDWAVWLEVLESEPSFVVTVVGFSRAAEKFQSR